MQMTGLGSNTKRSEMIDLVEGPRSPTVAAMRREGASLGSRSGFLSMPGVYIVMSRLGGF
jgi:hypothetical protein